MTEQATKAATAPISEKLTALYDIALDGLWGSVDRKLSRRRIAERRNALEEDRFAAERRREELETRKTQRINISASKASVAPEIAIGATIFRNPDDTEQVWGGLGRRP
ncbi:hypothetical protein ACOI1H_20560 [Loktanella sp. DJP18]|uniref:hypothetical protein n=1 Tax=Loktanella sp. DJP18 TaxID=3409788 RepID=UPI003BB49A6D